MSEAQAVALRERADGPARRFNARGKTVTIVTPVYNERDNVVALVDALQALFEGEPYALEIVLVNDGSEAETTAILDRLAERPGVVALHLSRNFGHQAALTAGLDAATGDATITMDSDLQHPPDVIPWLLAAWEAGADVVHTVREGEQEGWFKNWSSAAYYRLMRSLSPTPPIPGAADFRLFDRKVVAVLRDMTERARFLRGMSVWVGFPSARVPFRVAPRRAGTSRYTLTKMIRLALDGLVSLTSLPLYVAFYVGGGVLGASVLYQLYVLGVYFLTDDAVPGWSSLMFATLALSGVQIALMGVLGLYVARIYDEVRGRPRYILARRASAESP